MFLGPIPARASKNKPLFQRKIGVTDPEADTKTDTKTTTLPELGPTGYNPPTKR
jgi:hypothetical protein